MKKLLSTLLLSLCLVISNTYAQEAPSKGLKQISEPLVKEFIDFLADDEMRGRSTPSLELDQSAYYIASKLKSFGVKPINGSYFQSIPFSSKDLSPENCKFSLTKDNNTHEFQIKRDYTPLFNTASGEAVGELVFAGYGITAPELGYDDYGKIDVAGKIVLVMKQKPRQNDADCVFNQKEAAKYTDIDYKIENAIKHGASGFLLVTDPLDNIAITAQGYLWESLYSKGKTKDRYELAATSESTIPAAQVSSNVINHFFGSIDSLRTLQSRIDDQLAPASFTVKDKLLTLKVSLEQKKFPSNNVIGWIEGSDKQLKDEYVVIGAHYDHIGMARTPNHLNDSIMNGADDNASGTAAVMALAKAFGKVRKKPARSIVFILFTAEEIGLIGSDYYTKNPLFPIEKTTAMINLDMVGRNGTDTLYVVGEKYNPELAELVNQKIPQSGLQKEVMRFDMYQSSDYYPFYKKGVSAIGFTSGLHDDYHRAGDNPDKINHTKVRKIAQLAYRVAWEAAHTDKHFTIIEPTNL